MRCPIGLLVLGVAAMLLGPPAKTAQTNELHEALKLKPNHKQGRKLYETCAACHQSSGAGVADGSIPNIAGQHYQAILKQLADFRDTEPVNPRMERFASRHHLKGPQDLADVAAFISSLPAQPTQDFGSGQFSNLGLQAYARLCRHCHGAAGEGANRLGYPRLAGQHYRYLMKQLGPINVSSDHSKLLKSLTDEEIMGVADYLARLNPVSPASGDPIQP
jgi:cytochrome c553